MPSTPNTLALFSDLYELTMAEAYLAHGMTEEATFSLFFRKLPPNRNFLLACGVEELLEQVEALRFSSDDTAYLRSLKVFSGDFLDWLARYRFSGTIEAVAEGTPLFPNEPILEVTGPIAEVQILETLVINQIQLQSVLASKAARVVAAANGRRVVDFGSRRAQGVEAALAGARAFYIAGVDATSNLMAGAKYGIPVAGTMAHSFVQACRSEREAFQRFAETFPETTLLVDTYDTLEGVRRVIDLARHLGSDFRIAAIRLDSGDLLALSRQARSMLDQAGLHRVQIFASGSLNEFRIDELVRAGAPIDGFGVGTDMSVSADAPALDIVYKLCAFAGEGRLKLSVGKRTLPGRKQVFRRPDGDVIARREESLAGEPLLSTVVAAGSIVAPVRGLREIREAAAESIARLPHRLTALESSPQAFTVAVSPELHAYEAAVIQRIKASE
jgi:nicotinate phosphoribosyltransferase